MALLGVISLALMWVLSLALIAVVSLWDAEVPLVPVHQLPLVVQDLLLVGQLIHDSQGVRQVLGLFGLLLLVQVGCLDELDDVASSRELDLLSAQDNHGLSQLGQVLDDPLDLSGVPLGGSTVVGLALLFGHVDVRLLELGPAGLPRRLLALVPRPGHPQQVNGLALDFLLPVLAAGVVLGGRLELGAAAHLDIFPGTHSSTPIGSWSCIFFWL